MSFDINKLVRGNVLKLKPYSSARDDFKGNASVFLDANENPYPTDYNRYPDPHQRKLKEKIADLKGVKSNQIFLGNGSDEAIDLLIRTFCEPIIDNILILEPTYGMYTVSAEVNNVEIKTATLGSDFDIDLNEISNKWNAHTKLIFLCSPNNPSGNLLTKASILTLLNEFNGLVIVDEAYIDFTEDKGLIPYLTDFQNLVILQTLSKAWGLANLRLGICFANEEIIKVLDKIKPPYNINGITQRIALEKLEDVEQKNKCVLEIIAEREHLKKQLLKISTVLKVFPSQANFLLVKVSNAKNIYQKLTNSGIVVRDRSNVTLCHDCLRITVGTPTENKRLIFELNKI